MRVKDSGSREEREREREGCVNARGFVPQSPKKERKKELCKVCVVTWCVLEVETLPSMVGWVVLRFKIFRVYLPCGGVARSCTEENLGWLEKFKKHGFQFPLDSEPATFGVCAVSSLGKKSSGTVQAIVQGLACGSSQRHPQESRTLTSGGGLTRDPVESSQESSH